MFLSTIHTSLLLTVLFCQRTKAQCVGPDGIQQSQTCGTSSQCQIGFACINSLCCQTCQSRRQSSLGSAFVPNCDQQGNYASEQCSIRFQQTQCWCATITGEEIPQTRIFSSGPGTGTRNCDVERQRFTGGQQGQCSQNEEWNTCPSLCPQSCDNMQSTINCQPLSCIAGCICKSGFVRSTSRDPKSACVLISQCSNPPNSQCTDVNSQFNTCGSACPPSCGNLNPTCSRACTSGCFCNPGFIRQFDSSTSPCIQQNQCTTGAQQCTDINSQFTTCGSSCPASCTNPNPTCAQICVPGCFCRQGFLKLSDMTNAQCVIQNQCNTISTQCNDVNAQFTTCGSNCPPSCTTPNPQCTFQCTSGCACKQGFIKQNDQTNAQCILQSQCSSSGQCNDVNAQFSTCGSSCPPSCTNPNPSCAFQCTSGCYCRQGFVKQNDNPNSQCVQQNQCSTAGQCTDANSQFSTCGSSCPPSCTNPNPTCAFQCTSGCFCRQGFVKQNESPNSPCVQQNQCGTASQCTDVNSQFSQCGSNCPPSCTNQNPSCTFQCTSGCFCRQGYMKQNDNPNSLCILQTQCSGVGQCNDVNSQYSQCGSNCPPSCTTPNPFCAFQCTPGCFCKQGFIKQSDAFGASCVAASQCGQTQQCTFANEEFQTCTNTCGDSCNGLVPCTLGQCVPRCMCQNGFIRQTAAITSPCILRSQCSVNPGSKAGTCPSVPLFGSTLLKTDQCSTDQACTGDMKCCDTLIGKTCMGPDPNGGTGTGSLNGQCGQNQQQSTCTLTCVLGCDNFRNPPKCPTTCGPPGCVCQPGFVRRSSTMPSSECVALSTCT